MHAALFVVLPLLFWCLICLVQEVEEHEGHIPARKKTKTKQFRYFQDWKTALWGDWAGLTLIDAAFGLVMQPVYVPLLCVAAFIGFMGTWLFHTRAMQKNHQPDSGYPKAGIISLSGRLYLMYFFFQLSISAFLVLLACISSYLDASLLLALAGGGIYFLSLISDIEDGAFNLVS